MNDTHGVAGKGWYGFDLDGTLAVYDKWEGINHIGEPVKPMVDLIKRMHAEGKVVKILTARVAPRKIPDIKNNPYRGIPSPDYTRIDNAGIGLATFLGAMYARETWGAREFIIDWCLKNLGFFPEITHEKDHLMLELYDDRVKQVVPNKGILVEDMVGPRIEIHPVEICRERLTLCDRVSLFVGRVVLFAGWIVGSFWLINIVAHWIVTCRIAGK